MNIASFVEVATQLLNFISGFATALVNFLTIGKRWTDAIKQLPQPDAAKKAEEVHQNKEIAGSIVHLFAIEAIFTFGKGLLLVIVFLTETIALARIAELLLRRGLTASPSDTTPSSKRS